MQDAQARSGDENTSHYRHLTDEFFGDEVAREEGQAVDGRHPYKDNHTDERDAETVGRCQNEDGDEVERSCGHEVRVVVVKRTHYGTHHGKRSDAAEQHTGGDALSKVRSRDASCGLFHALVHLEESSDESANGQTEDEEHWILRFLHALDGDVHT